MAQRIGFFSVCLCSLTLIQYITTRVVQGAVVAPSSQNVFEGSHAIFHCSGINLRLLTWTIDEKLIFNGEEHAEFTEGEVNDTINSSLSILALPKYNASSVVCVQYNVIINEQPKKYPAFLHIQGLLNSVSNLSIEFGTHYFHLSWNAPFSLPGLDISYNVTIHSRDFTTEFLVTSANYSVPSSSFTPCHSYQISVVSINEAGMGNMSVITRTIPAKLLAVQTANIMNIASNVPTKTLSANISIPVNLSCVIKEYTSVVAEKLSENMTEIMPLTYDADLNFINITLLDLPPDSTLNISLTISTILDAVIQFVNLSTFDTQSLQVTKHFNDTVCFNCSLIMNSAAKGCKLIIESNDDYNTCYQRQSKLFIFNDMHEVCFDGIFSGSYAIIVYDIDLDNATSVLPAISKEVQVIGKHCQQRGMTTVDTPELPATTVPDGNMTVLPSITVTTLNNNTDSGEQTAIILVTTFTCLIIVIIIVALTVLLYMRISKKTGITAAKEKEPCSTLKIQTVEEANKYIQSIRNDEAIYAVPELLPNHNTVLSISNYKVEKPYKMSDDEEEYVLMHSAGSASCVKHTNDNEYIFSQVHCKYAQHVKSTYYNHQDNSVL